MRLAGLLFWAGLAACQGTAFETGPSLASYGLSSPDGELEGTAELFRDPTGEGRVERATWNYRSHRGNYRVHFSTHPAEHHLVQRQTHHGIVSWTHLEGDRWSQRQGAHIRRGHLDREAEALVSFQSMPGASAWPLGLLQWTPALREADGKRADLLAFNTHTGRYDPLVLEPREDRALSVSPAGPGLSHPEIQATRWFAHTPAAGRTLWTDPQGGILAMEDPFLGWTVAREGFSVPEPAPEPPPAGLVQEDLLLPTPEVRLAGTLVRPAASNRPLPVVILVHGSGGIDRDGNTGGLRHGRHRALAHRLAPLGAAVLRYDKRGVAESTMGDEGSATLQDLAEDVVAWMDHLAARPGIDGDHFVIVGHSEGGYIAPLLSVEDERVRGVVMLAGPVSPLDEVMRIQLRLILRAHGVPEEEIRQARRAQNATLRVIASGRDRDLPTPLMGEVGSQWLRSHFHHDPAEVLRQVRVPLLAIYGSEDLQVPPSEADRLRHLTRDHPHARIEVVEGMDHLLAETETPGMGVYGDPDRTLHPELVDLLRTWFSEQLPTVR